MLHQLLHDGETPHEHLFGRGRLVTLLGIADKKCLRVQQVSRCLVSPSEETEALNQLTGLDASATQPEHDFLLALQNACLTFDPKERPSAAELKDAVEDAFGTIFLDGGYPRPEKRASKLSTPRVVSRFGEGGDAEEADPGGQLITQFPGHRQAVRVVEFTEKYEIPFAKHQVSSRSVPHAMSS